MRLLMQGLSVVLAFSYVPQVSHSASLDLSNEEILQKTIDYRIENFSIGQIRFESTYPARKGQKRPVYGYDLWFHNESIRLEQTLLRYGEWKLKQGKKKGYAVRRIWANDKFIEQHREDPKLAVTIRSQEEPKRRRMRGIFHPRAIGTSASGISSISDSTMKERLLPSTENGMVTHARPVMETIEGENLYRLEYLSRNGGLYTIWVDPERGHNIVGFQFAIQREGHEYVSKQQIELAQYGEQEFWYPKYCRCVSIEDGVESVVQEIMVKKAAFGIAPDPKVFKLAGMNLPIGQSINDHSRPAYDGELYWDGEYLIHKIGDKDFRLAE